jgi:hypothetical protein
MSLLDVSSEPGAARGSSIDLIPSTVLTDPTPTGMSTARGAVSVPHFGTKNPAKKTVSHLGG